MDAKLTVVENMALLRETQLLLTRSSTLATRCGTLILDHKDMLLASCHWTERSLWAIPSDRHWTERLGRDNLSQSKSAGADPKSTVEG